MVPAAGSMIVRNPDISAERGGHQRSFHVQRVAAVLADDLADDALAFPVAPRGVQ
ncbi:MAG TPA: hypothetical protein VGU21_05765 [Streptosporangiaceae bacterium]|nr:hypothetical protein [Streptosporangiaceae bacterium]